MGVFVLKKTLFSLLISFGLLLAFSGLDTEASVTSANVLEGEGVGIQAATTASLTPADLSGRTNTWYTLTVKTNQTTSVSYTFNPGIDGLKARTEPGTISRNFSQQWETTHIKTFNTSARVLSQEYGPSPWVYGKAVISY